MPEQLFRLVYCSRNAVPEPDLAAEIERILETSRRNNLRAGLTGALLFNRGAFGQVLEGEYAALERTFEIIQNDERHDTVVVLGLEPVSERGFGPWAMAHVGSEPLGLGTAAGMAVAGDFDPARCSGADLFETLRGIVVGQERSLPAA